MKSFGSCNSCKRLISSRLHKLDKSKLPFVSRVELIRSNLSSSSAHVSGVSETAPLERICRPPELSQESELVNGATRWWCWKVGMLYVAY